MFVPLLGGRDIAAKTITADALLTQRKLARYLVEERGPHYLFTVKDNQPTLMSDIRLLFKVRGEPDLDGVYFVGADGTVEQFRWVRAPTTAGLAELTHTIAERVGRFLQRHGLLECDGEQSYLAAEAVDEGSMDPLLARSITYRTAVGPKAGRCGSSPASKTQR